MNAPANKLTVLRAIATAWLVVGTLDKRGEFDRGNRIDRLCRWIFPLIYFALMLLMFVAAIILY